MEHRTIGLDKARAKLGDLAADAVTRRTVTILTSHGHPVAAIVPPDMAATDERWNDAIDWLLNSRHCADPGIQAAFWGLADGNCTRENVEEWVATGGGQEPETRRSAIKIQGAHSD